MKLQTEASSVNGDCIQHTMLMIQAVGRGEQWALKMIDAMAKPPAGLMNYKLSWWGDWSECINTWADQYTSANATPTHPFHGNYCPASFKLPIQSPMVPEAKLSLATCLPSTCSPDDIEVLLSILNDTVLLPMNYSLPAASVSCKEQRTVLDGRAIAVVVICAIFMAIMTIATLYDVLYIHWLAKPSATPAPYQNGHAKQNGYTQQNGVRSPDVYIVTDETNLDKLPEKDPNGIDTFNKKNAVVDAELAKQTEAQVKEEKVENKYKPSPLESMLLSFSVFTNGTTFFPYSNICYRTTSFS